MDKKAILRVLIVILILAASINAAENTKLLWFIMIVKIRNLEKVKVSYHYQFIQVRHPWNFPIKAPFLVPLRRILRFWCRECWTAILKLSSLVVPNSRYWKTRDSLLWPITDLADILQVFACDSQKTLWYLLFSYDWECILCFSSHSVLFCLEDSQAILYFNQKVRIISWKCWSFTDCWK